MTGPRRTTGSDQPQDRCVQLPRRQPQPAVALRRITTLQETAALLDSRVARAGRPDLAARLRRRGGEYRQQAQRFRAELVAAPATAARAHRGR